MMRVEVIVEEPSMEAALRELLPGIIGRGRARWKVVNMQSKGSLLKRLPSRLAAYRRRIEAGENLRLVILVDRDDDDCRRLKDRLEAMAREAGLATKRTPDGRGDFQVVTRIAIHELESWFMGDHEALQAAFTSLRGYGVPASFRNPDNGGTWERLHRFLKKHGIYRRHYPKIEAARRIAAHMDPDRNRSHSFQVFRQGVEACLP